MMQFLMSSLQASARPDCGGQRRIGVEGKSKYCLRWKLFKTGGESKASRSTALRIFIRGMRGLLGRGSEPPILQGLPPACRASADATPRQRSSLREISMSHLVPLLEFNRCSFVVPDNLSAQVTF